MGGWMNGRVEEWNGVDWNGLSWSGVELSGVGWGGVRSFLSFPVVLSLPPPLSTLPFFAFPRARF